MFRAEVSDIMRAFSDPEGFCDENESFNIQNQKKSMQGINSETNSGQFSNWENVHDKEAAPNFQNVSFNQHEDELSEFVKIEEAIREEVGCDSLHPSPMKQKKNQKKNVCFEAENENHSKINYDNDTTFEDEDNDFIWSGEAEDNVYEFDESTSDINEYESGGYDIHQNESPAKNSIAKREGEFPDLEDDPFIQSAVIQKYFLNPKEVKKNVWNPNRHSKSPKIWNRDNKRRVGKVKVGKLKSRPSMRSEKEKESPPKETNLLKENMEKLEKELLDFRAETTRLKKIRVEQAKELSFLRQDNKRVKEKLKKERESFEKYKDSEMKKLKREKMNIQKELRNLKNVPSREERDQLQNLKKEMDILKKKMKEKEDKNKFALKRFKLEIQRLTDKNEELREQLRGLEQERLRNWEKTDNIEKKAKKSTEYHEKEQQISVSSGDDTSEILFSPELETENEKYNDIEVEEDQELEQENNKTVVQSTNYHEDGVVEEYLSDGGKRVIYPNGTVQRCYSSGYMHFKFMNGDIKEIFPDGRVAYLFKSANIIHTKFVDGLQMFRFNNNQVEKHFPDGSREVQYPDGTKKFIFKNGEETTHFPKGLNRNFLLNENMSENVEIPENSENIDSNSCGSGYNSNYNPLQFTTPAKKRFQ